MLGYDVKDLSDIDFVVLCACPGAWSRSWVGRAERSRIASEIHRCTSMGYRLTLKIKVVYITIQLNQGISFNLPYADNKFDQIVSSLFFHHLTRENKLRTMAEIKQVLKPAGELHLVDWGKPQNFLMRAAFYLVQMLDGFETTADNVAGLLPELIRTSKFENVYEINQLMSIFGTLAFYKAVKPKP